MAWLRFVNRSFNHSGHSYLQTRKKLSKQEAKKKSKEKKKNKDEKNKVKDEKNKDKDGDNIFSVETAGDFCFVYNYY